MDMRGTIPCMLLWTIVVGQAQADQMDIKGPPGSGRFGETVKVLPNGNIVIVDPAANFDRGAVYLYAPSGAQISVLSGGSSGDRVGSGGITLLDNGNYVVGSPQWSDPVSGETAVGAATWASATTGTAGVVSASNSLVGDTTDDAVGRAVFALRNGNYVVAVPDWDDPATDTADVGAVTWANGLSGKVGALTAADSFVGSTELDQVGSGGAVALPNGDYVVRSSQWSNGPSTLGVGAVTLLKGNASTAAGVSPLNSLVGTTAGDFVGSHGVTVLSSGNYIVRSPLWANAGAAQAGAVTWASGDTGRVGPVTLQNSLVGSSSMDKVGSALTTLTNGNYVVGSWLWDSGGVPDVGAATWGSGSGGTVGVIDAGNSLVGTQANDAVGTGVTALTNGHYVVRNPEWHAQLGAVTWGEGAYGSRHGAVGVGNSLVGTAAGDRIASGGVVALSNGNYAVASPAWSKNAVSQVGAASWCDGAQPTTGTVDAAHALTGTLAGDAVGLGGIVALANGHYVVKSSQWNQNRGAATWRSGNGGAGAEVGAGNSLVGSIAGDRVGASVAALVSGHFVVVSDAWSDAGLAGVGATTWANGNGSVTGAVSATNSLVGTTSLDRIGLAGVVALSNGSYLVRSPVWDAPARADAGAVTFVRGDGAAAGVVSAMNGVVGSVPGEGSELPFDYDAAANRLVVGRPASNAVSVYRDDGLFLASFETL
jgi:hypothetical protein